MAILISACLLGVACRYDGDSRPLPAETLHHLRERYDLIPICPEQLGGLSTPRVPAERLGERVVTRDGGDVTAQYERGAAEALRLAKLFGCRRALLKARSPSCGRGPIYDGTHSGHLCDRPGTTAEVLAAHGIRIYTEEDLEELLL